MKALIILTLILITITLGHDAWVSYENELPFALSDFGWIVTNYIPSAEQYILDNINPDDQARYISPVFKLETVWVICLFMGFFVLLAGFAKLSENMGEINIFKRNPSKNKVSIRKRDQGSRLKYKRK